MSPSYSNFLSSGQPGPLALLPLALLAGLAAPAAALPKAQAQTEGPIRAPHTPRTPVDLRPGVTQLRAPASAASVEREHSAFEGQGHDPRVAAQVALPKRRGLQRGTLGDDLWIRGDTYKASVSEDGFTYVPFFGSKASQNWPITFRLRTLEAGDEAETLMSPSLRFEGDAAVLDRGPVEARYELRQDSVEQTFVIASSEVSGDLDFTIDVDTDLAVKVDGDGLLFSGPDGSVTFGAATVLDGAGTRLQIPMGWDGETIRYRVPAAFVDAAIGEIVLDPLITTFTIDSFSLDLGRPDVAYDADQDQFLVVYEEEFSATDGDIYFRVLDGTSYAVVDEGYLENSTARAYDPHAATIAASNRFVVVYTEDDTFDRPSILMRSALSGSMVDFGAVSTVASFDEFFTREHPDVGGESYEGAFTTNALVVFEEKPRGSVPLPSGIRARLIDRDGVLAPAFITVAPSLGADSYERPVISRYSGDPAIFGAWWVAARVGVAGANPSEVQAFRLDFNGTVTTSNIEAWSATTGEIVRSMDISAPHTGATGEVFDLSVTVQSGGMTDSYISSVARFDDPFVTTSPLSLKDISRSLEDGYGSLATLGDRSILSYFDDNFLAGGFEVRSTTLELPDLITSGVGERRIRSGELRRPFPTQVVASVSKASGGTGTNSADVFLAWSDFGTSGPDGNIYGSIVRTSSPQVAAGTFCRGNPNSTGEFSFLAAFGDSGLTSPKEMLVLNLPSNSLGYFLASQAPGSSVPPGSQGRLCLSGAIGRYAGSVQNSGAAGRVTFTVDPTSLPSPTGSVSATAGQQFFFQYWHRDANPTSTSNLSNAVAVQF